MRSIGSSSLVAVALALLAVPAHAHINLLSPTPRTEMQKQGPCGAGPDDPRGPTVATFKPGEKIMVSFDEFVNHPGHFRIAFDDDGQDIFVDPKGFDDVGGGPGVLIDGIPDTKAGGVSMVEVTLPDIECDNCVLQVIQVMTDKPPYGDGNDMYYQCADIALMGEVASTTSGEPGTSSGPGTTEPGTTGIDTTGVDSNESIASVSVTASESNSTDATASASDTATATATGEAPTTGGGGDTVDASTGGPAGSSGAASDGAETTSPGDDKGCGCRGDADGGWLALALVPLLVPRRRRA